MTYSNFDKKLENLDLSGIMARIQFEQSFDDATLERAEKEYRQYLKLNAILDLSEQLVAPPLADLVWHMHILHTQKYAEDCAMLFGKMLHHDPSLFGEDYDFEALRRETQALYMKNLGIKPGLMADGESFIQVAGVSACGS